MLCKGRSGRYRRLQRCCCRIIRYIDGSLLLLLRLTALRNPYYKLCQLAEMLPFYRYRNISVGYCRIKAGTVELYFRYFRRYECCYGYFCRAAFISGIVFCFYGNCVRTSVFGNTRNRKAGFIFSQCFLLYYGVP